MRPFACPVTILNTIDPLGKFDGKAKEGFLVGYSVNSKAFKVFNSQTRKVEENIHVNFLENKPNVAGQGRNWLFDIDSLTNSMNYQPVTARNQTNKNAGPQEAYGNTGLKQSVDAVQSEEKNVSTQQYIVFPLWSSIFSSYKSSDENDTVDDCNNLHFRLLIYYLRVMDAPTLPVFVERNLGDPIDIKVDIVHPVPVDVFPAATVEKRARMELERQLASVQESQRQDQENFRKLQEFVTSQLGRHP
ncbi:hypothetical protein Tco_0859154 [Tanacetum coccineum]|uniref:Retroviral polymerase SH3-like domain-containing protein n=1 Tax=Tanacetum coccineum TaxID=301880 RepID=A0ABQ5BE61_9ASTR